MAIRPTTTAGTLLLLCHCFRYRVSCIPEHDPVFFFLQACRHFLFLVIHVSLEVYARIFTNVKDPFPLFRFDILYARLAHDSVMLLCLLYCKS